jgi:photosystem II stability/assembly factor-like uncharacterized protein
MAVAVFAGHNGAAQTPAIPERPSSEEGCLEGRVLDYLERHGDDGRIDSDALLYRTVELKQELEAARRGVRPQVIAGSVWTSMGPNNGAGRMPAVAVHPTVPGTAIVGAAGGGAWKTTDSGATWTSLTDTLANLSVGAITYAPSNPSIVYLGTGEGGHAGDFIPGIGLFASLDGGATWEPPQEIIASQYYRLSVHPSNPLEIVAATSSGLLRSTNGQNGPWTTILGTRSSGGVPAYGVSADLVRNPADANILYAASYDTLQWCARTGVDCKDPGEWVSPRVLKSVDAGQSWKEVVQGFPVSTGTMRVGRVSLAIAPSSPETLYAATSLFDAATGQETSQIYKTTNGGASWTPTGVGTSSDSEIRTYLRTQGWYDNTIVVSPQNPNVVIAGGVTYIKSVDGGLTWSRLFTSSNVHVDAHDLRYDAGGTLYIANDGGIWTSTDDGVTVMERNANLPTRQFYALSVDPVNRMRTFGGQQDNGTIRRGDAGGTEWDRFFGGDGFDCPINPDVPSLVYATWQTGNILRTADSGAATPILGYRTPVYAEGEEKPFFTRLVLDPSNPSTVYTVSWRVWRSTTGGDSWTPLPTTTPDGPIWGESLTIRAIAVAPSDPKVLMIGKAVRSTVFRSVDGGLTWKRAATGLPTRIVNFLEIDPANPNIVWAAMAGLTKPSVYQSIDGGATWSGRGEGLPGFSAQVIRVDPTDSNTIYCGTDVGVYRSTDGGASWSRFGTGMPAASVYDLAILRDGSLMRAATHGRGVWELTIDAPPNHAPIVTASASRPSPVVVRKGEQLTFSGAFRDDDGHAMNARWTFPDDWSTSTAANGASVTHAFTRAGTHPVTLSAVDSLGGRGAATIQVRVQEEGDDCSSAVEIPSTGPFPYTATFNSEGLTKGLSDPVGSTATGSCNIFNYQASTWLRFTPSTTGSYTFSLCGSAISGVLIGYRAPGACGPYTPSGICIKRLNERDATNYDCGAEGTSTTAFLTAGETTYLEVTNYYLNDFGLLSLTIAPSETPLSPLAVSVDAGSGTSRGGTEVTIVGSGFAEGMTVFFGEAAASNVRVLTPQLILATTPPNAAGVVDVAVAIDGGSRSTLRSGFTYVEPVTGKKRRAVK